ncbi:glycosyltransferase, partial [Candidatus Venteria ishoeyi]|uniref:glycosyltransferase n=1 Tax=Candidatus Venteria ishoeyi TaxID=1899563 RepID=UPI000B239F74
NGSTEKATFKLYRKHQKRLGQQLRILHEPGTFNFSYLVNQGVAKAKGEMILLLNNDTEIISPSNWLEEMVGYAQREDVGCVGCKLLYEDDTVQHGGIIAGVGGVAGHSHLFRTLQDPGYMGRLWFVANCTGVTAACLMVKRSLWDEVNGFDENLAVAFNDVDFNFKVMDAGYRNLVLPQVLFYHYESKSRGLEDTPKKQQRFALEIETMLTRWKSSYIGHDPYYSPHLNQGRGDFSIDKDSVYYCQDNAEILP